MHWMLISLGVVILVLAGDALVRWRGELVVEDGFQVRKSR